MEPVTVNFALTREDCVQGSLARLSMLFPKKTYARFRTAGFLLFCAGCLLITESILLKQPLAWAGAVFAAAGVFAAFFLRPAQELSVRRMAGEGFDSGRFGTPAQTVIFGTEGIEVRSERYEAKIPYRMLSGAYEGRDAILVFTGADEWRTVPKRAMSPVECGRTAALLANGLHEKFRREVS